MHRRHEKRYSHPRTDQRTFESRPDVIAHLALSYSAESASARVRLFFYLHGVP